MTPRKKRRPPVYQTERRQTEKGADQTQLVPGHDDTTRRGPRQGIFEKILPKGEENAIKMPQLRQIMGMSEARYIQKMISDERAAGAVILSSERGYFLPDDGEKGRREVEAFVSTMMAKGISTMNATRSAFDYLRTLPGQIRFDDGGEL